MTWDRRGTKHLSVSYSMCGYTRLCCQQNIIGLGSLWLHSDALALQACQNCLLLGHLNCLVFSQQIVVLCCLLWKVRSGIFQSPLARGITHLHKYLRTDTKGRQQFATLFLKCFLGLCILLFYVYKYSACMPCALGSKQGIGSTGIESYSSESSCGCWDSNLSPLEEVQVLLTAKSTLQSHTKYIKGKSKHIPRLCLPQYSSRDREEMTVLQVFLPTKEQKHTKV